MGAGHGHTGYGTGAAGVYRRPQSSDTGTLCQHLFARPVLFPVDAGLYRAAPPIQGSMASATHPGRPLCGAGRTAGRPGGYDRLCAGHQRHRPGVHRHHLRTVPGTGHGAGPLFLKGKIASYRPDRSGAEYRRGDRSGLHPRRCQRDSYWALAARCCAVSAGQRRGSSAPTDCKAAPSPTPRRCKSASRCRR